MTPRTRDAPAFDADGALRREMQLWQSYHDREHDQAEKALDKAYASMDKRLEGMNEFRSALKDQTATFLTNEVFMVQHDALIQRIDRVVARMDEQDRWKSGIEGRTIGITAAIGIAVVVINIAIDLIR